MWALEASAWALRFALVWELQPGPEACAPVRAGFAAVQAGFAADLVGSAAGREGYRQDCLPGTVNGSLEGSLQCWLSLCRGILDDALQHFLMMRQAVKDMLQRTGFNPGISLAG